MAAIVLDGGWDSWEVESVTASAVSFCLRQENFGLRQMVYKCVLKVTVLALVF